MVPPGLSTSFERAQRLQRPRQVLQHEAHEHVVERCRRKGQGEDVLLPELHIGEACGRDPALASCEEIGERSIEVKRVSGLLRASVTVCAPVPQPASSTELPAG